MRALDWGLIGLLLAGRLALGVYFNRRQTSTGEYFLAGQRMGWGPVALSILASLLSGISFIGHPARVYGYDCAAMGFAIAAVLVTPVVMYGLLPAYRRLNVRTAYEYLEIRFGLNVRLLASALFILKRLFWMALVVLAPAMLLNTITGIPVETCVLLVGLFTTLYTSLGGLSAMIWADVITFVVLLGAQILIIGSVAGRLDGGLGELWTVAVENRKAWASLDFDWTRLTFWTAIVSGLILGLEGMGADQITVQLLMSARDERQARRSLLFMALFKVPGQVLLLGLGVAIWVFYHAFPDRPGPGQAEGAVPHFVMTELPTGAVGFILGAILCATMSCFDSGLNSLVAAVSVDWVQRLLRPGAADRRHLLFSKLLTYGLGAAVSLMAILIYRAGFTSLIDKTNNYLGFFGGGLLGIFLLAAFTRRSRALPTVFGCVAATAGIFLFDRLWNAEGALLNPILYGVFGCAGTMVLGYGGSMILTPKTPRHPTGKTPIGDSGEAVRGVRAPGRLLSTSERSP